MWQWESYGLTWVKISSAWIVDGQQRAAALRQIKRSRFPISVVASFLMELTWSANNSSWLTTHDPLPKSLIYELLPCIGNSVPIRLQKRQTAYHLLTKLNAESMSPFRNRIATATSGLNPEASIKDLSVLKMIEKQFRWRDTSASRVKWFRTTFRLFAISGRLFVTCMLMLGNSLRAAVV